MKKYTWIKPDFELESFIPNDYIAACGLQLGKETVSGYAVRDINQNGSYDGDGLFDASGNPNPTLTGIDNQWYNNNSGIQDLHPVKESIVVEHGKYQLDEKYILVTSGPNGGFTSYNRAIIQVEGESGWVVFTANKASGHS